MHYKEPLATDVMNSLIFEIVSLHQESQQQESSQTANNN